MYKAINIFLALLICFTVPATAAAAGNRPLDVWNFYHFDGSVFTPGPAVDGRAFVAVREKVRPVVLTAPAANIEQSALPDGAGVIAGICYLQSSGGKLGGGSGFKADPRLPLLVSAKGKQLVTVQTDDQGYFVVVLPAGTYTIGSGQVTTEVSVEGGTTTLVPLRTGKRMVD